MTTVGRTSAEQPGEGIYRHILYGMHKYVNLKGAADIRTTLY